MIISLRPDHHVELGPVTVPAFRSLTQSHVDAIAQSVGKAQIQWSVQPYNDYDGYLSAVVEPCSYNSPTFLVSGTTEHIELSMLDVDDRMLSCGSFDKIEAVTAQLVRLLSNAAQQSTHYR